METDGRRLFVLEHDRIYAVHIISSSYTTMKGHDHFIRHCKVCQGYLWSACRDKVVQWDLDSLQKIKEWNHSESTGIFEYGNHIIVAQRNTVTELGSHCPFLEIADNQEVLYVSKRYIVLIKDKRLSLYMEHQLKTPESYPCVSFTMIHDRILVQKQTQIECCDLQSLSSWKIKNIGYGHRFSPDGKFIFIKSYEPRKGIIVCAHTGSIVQEFKLPSSSLIWHPDARQLVWMNKGVKTILLYPYQQQTSAGIPLSLFKRWVLFKIF